MSRRSPWPAGLTSVEEVFRWFMPGDPPGECWDWTAGTHSSGGYGIFYFGGKQQRAHVVAHTIFNGPVTELSVLHSCDRAICVQPAHLHLGTQATNMAEMRMRGRSPRGEGHHHARLTESDVRMIRTSDLGGAELAKMLGVSKMAVSQVKTGRTWKHVV